MDVKYIASCSFGKDSLAMVLKLIETNSPLDEVVFYDTGAEFQAIYDIRDKMLPLFTELGIKYAELKPEESFFYKMFEKPVCKRGTNIIHQYGYSWCGGVCRWGTTEKIKALEKYCEGSVEYVGLAVDELCRLEKERKGNKVFPLANWGMTEADCLLYCRKQGVSWDEEGVDLYEILDRVSCWCCANKNKKELYNIYKYLPQYWRQLKELQSKTSRPMKKFCNKKYGHYGNVFEMEKVFSQYGT